MTLTQLVHFDCEDDQDNNQANYHDNDDNNDERLKQNEEVCMPLTQLSGVASTILSCRKMGMCSPIELNKPTIVAIVLLVSF